MPVLPWAFLGFEGLVVWAKKGAGTPVGPILVIQASSEGIINKRSVQVKLFSHSKGSLCGVGSSKLSATAQLEVMAGVLSLYTREGPLSCTFRLSQASLTSKKTCYVPVMHFKALLSEWPFA